MTTMLEKCKALAKKTHQSSSVANQALKDKCKSMGVKFAADRHKDIMTLLASVKARCSPKSVA